MVQRTQKKTAKAIRQRALNAFDIATDDDYYMRGMRQQQDIDLEHISDDRIRELLSNIVKSEDDEEIDSDEAMGSASDISLGEPGSGDEDDWGDSLDEYELLPLSEVWDINDGIDDSESTKDKKKHKVNKNTENVEIKEVEAEQESEQESEGENEVQSEEADDESEELGLSAEYSSEDEEQTAALQQAIKSISGQDNFGSSDMRLAETGEENRFALPPGTESVSLADIVPETQSSKAKTLSVPAPKRIQERVNRGAAYELASKELGKWSDTVQANRQAEHLQFPINPPRALESAFPFTVTSAGNGLEDKINQILETSALADEKDISTFEETAPSKLSIEDLRKRRQELRYMRDLMLREERRAKRIKKIKSKSYRKVHKKDRQRMAELEEGGEESDGDQAERDRALERATLRHKSSNSKWAKRMLDQGLTRDAHTRAELEEMLRQGDSLRQKIRGNEQDSDSDFAGFDDEEQESQINKQGVMSMKFMQEADQRHREENNKMIQDDYDSNQEENIGRKSFTPASQQLKQDMEDENDTRPKKERKEKVQRGDETVEFRPQPRLEKRKRSEYITAPTSTEDAPVNPWLAATAKASVPGTVRLAAPQNDKKKRSEVVIENTFGDGLVREKDLSLQQKHLVQQAFAGDDVVAEFDATKQAEVDADGDQEIDETLPGWGNWSNEKSRIQKIRKVTGVNEKQRKDYNKSNVIINEKLNKRAAKYSASAVPFPFENRQQYERSLRMPIGQEWVTKDTFQRQTKPRVLVKRASIIDPLKKK